MDPFYHLNQNPDFPSLDQTQSFPCHPPHLEYGLDPFDTQGFSVLNSVPVPAAGPWTDSTTSIVSDGLVSPLSTGDRYDDASRLLVQSTLVPPNRKRRHSPPNPPPKRVKADEELGHTTKDRAQRVCLWCQMGNNKHKCNPGPDPNGPCEACIKKAGQIGRLECRKARFVNIQIIRLGPTWFFAYTFRWLQKGSHDPQKAKWKRQAYLPTDRNRRYTKLRLSQGHSGETLDLRVQEFNPLDGDTVDYKWSANGMSGTYECPHYAITDTTHATAEIHRYIEASTEQYIDKLLPLGEDPKATLVRAVFQQALDWAHDSSLLDMTIKFWVAGRFIEDPWSVQGNETLGMMRDRCPESPYAQRIPVTPMMDFQIDNIVIYDHLQKLLQNIRRDMRLRIMPMANKADWFDIYLSKFILLHHVDLTMKHDIAFAKQHELPTKFSNELLIEMTSFGANTLLEYHQHEKGHFPLSAPDWHDVQKVYTFDEGQTTFLHQVRELIGQIEAPNNAGDDLYWPLQLHDSQWQPADVKFV